MLFTRSEWENPKVIYAKELLNPLFTVLFFAVVTMIAYPLAVYYGIAGSLLYTMFVGATVLTTGCAYGILNDLRACRVNLEYFTQGHQSGQEHGLVKDSDDPNVHAVAWGVAATFPLALLAAVLFMAAEVMLGPQLFLAGLSLFPVAAVPVLMYGEYASRAKIAKGVTKIESRSHYNYVISANSMESISNWEMLKIEESAKTWFANSARNRVGYDGLPILCLLQFLAMVLGVPMGLNLSLMVKAIIVAIPPLVVSVGMGYFFYQLGPKRQNDGISCMSFDPSPCACYILKSTTHRPLEQGFNIVA